MIRAGDPFLLLNRPADFVRVGVHWSNVDVDVAGDEPLLVAGEGATLTLTLPPQAIGEQSFMGGVLADARLAGPSRLSFALPAGTRIALSAEGLLTGISQGLLVAAGSADDATGTRLEVPAGLILTVDAADGGADAATAPIAGATDTTGLWQIELHGVDGLVRLRPLAARDLGLNGTLALTYDERLRIVGSGTGVTGTLSMGALGASLDAELASDTFRWSHHTAQGRDQRVMIESKGLLYPLGHRARSVSISERTIGDEAGAAAAIRTFRYIVVDEPVRSTPREDFRFAQVEILTRKLAYAAEVNVTRRPVPEIDLPEEQQQADFSKEAEALQARGEEISQGLSAPLGNLSLVLGDPNAAEYEELGAQIEQWQSELDNPTGDEVPSGVAAVKAALAAALKRQREIWPLIKEAIADFKAEAAGIVDRLRAIARESADLKARIEAIKLVLANPAVVAFWPGDVSGARLPFDVRLATPRGDLVVRIPLMFVNDVTTVGDLHWPDFSSLTDPGIARTLRSKWQGDEAGHVDLAGGVSFDLVQDAAPLPGDVHEIHKLVIEAVDAVEQFAPRIAGIEAKVAALRALLPNEDKLISLAYNTAADAVKSPLVPTLPIAINFLAHADRAGGLVAPVFGADALSRTLGPVARSVLDEAELPDFASLYKETRLLGLSLGELIDSARQGVTIPGGPTIVPVLDGVRPIGVRMEWLKLPLKAAGIFRPRVARPPATAGSCELDLEVRVVAEDSVTTATVREFALALPPTDTVVTLSFKSLRMVQEKGRPPAVQVEGFDFELEGALALLRTLQEEVLRYFSARNPGIVVRRTPTGIAAGYAFVLPEVAAGVFLMRNMGVSIDIDIPFNGDAVRITLSFARPENPFVLAVTIFGGGGYFLITMGSGEIQAVDLLLQFGAFVSVSFVIAKGEVHAYGAVQLKVGPNGSQFMATLRLGGSIDVLGIVSVAIELVLMLEYDPDDNILSGRATLVIEIHVLFFSRSVKLDSGEWILAGSKKAEHQRLIAGGGDERLAPGDAEREWHNYWQAFSTWTA
ncbi:hypothetical protein [Sphingomonas sp. BAUL-RG-20F-R05-02]|uniref:hypothetical protein n=1 Tax=Sphingomonas sp. BAUL-RG-20F-R05-02 TaxID=2914830 RepID=UPI001F5724F1|nr:hypothetical protein [Sphingomonas sp. BAUL-RG-20F-R05-02]